MSYLYTGEKGVPLKDIIKNLGNKNYDFIQKNNGGKKMEKLSIDVYFPQERHMNQFLNMLAWMELCGNVGHCTDFQVRLDGDGSARPKFKFDSEEMQKSFDDLRTDMISELKKIPMYPDDIDIHVCIS